MDWGQLLSGLLGSGLGAAIASGIWALLLDRKLERFKTELAKEQKVHSLQFDAEFAAYQKLFALMMGAFNTNFVIVNGYKHFDAGGIDSMNPPALQLLFGDLGKRLNELRKEREILGPFIDIRIYQEIGKFDECIETVMEKFKPILDGVGPADYSSFTGALNQSFDCVDFVRDRIRERIGIGMKAKA